MGFNNGFERNKFEAAWKKLRVEYSAAGMDEEAIEKIYQYDLDMFNSNRRYAEHTQEMPYQVFEDDGDVAADDKTALLVKFFDSVAVMPRDTDENRRYNWLDEIDSEKLAAALKKLSAEDIELLTLYVFDGYVVTDIAAIKGIAHQNVSKKIRRIKEFLKNI